MCLLGIGYYTLLALVKKGAHVIGTVRSEDKAKDTLNKLISELGEESRDLIDLKLVDLSSLASVSTLASEILKEGVKLDIVILNAGFLSPDYQTTADGYESMVSMSTFHLILCFL